MSKHTPDELQRAYEQGLRGEDGPCEGEPFTHWAEGNRLYLSRVAKEALLNEENEPSVQELKDCIRDLLMVVEVLMPGILLIEIQDYSFLNDTLNNAQKLKK